MKYIGSKARIANDLIQVIRRYEPYKEVFIEPFCGGCNLTSKLPNTFSKIIANDKNLYLIEMFKALQRGRVFPTQIDKELYDDVRRNYRNGGSKYDQAFTGWVGFIASYNGRFFDGGYSGCHKNRNYIKESARNIMKQIPQLQNVEFISGDYKDVYISGNCIVYCDPPYKNTKGYQYEINHNEFWEWCRKISQIDGVSVFVSEYEAPEDFQCVFENNLTNTMHQKNTYKITERLFLIN